MGIITGGLEMTSYRELRPQELRTTITLDSIEGLIDREVPCLIGQERGLSGMRMFYDLNKVFPHNNHYNCFVMGYQLQTKNDPLLQEIEKESDKTFTPPDQIVVHSLRAKSEDKFFVLKLPAGKGSSFMDTIQELFSTISENYLDYFNAAERKKMDKANSLLSTFNQKAAPLGFSLAVEEYSVAMQVALQVDAKDFYFAMMHMRAENQEKAEKDDDDSDDLLGEEEENYVPSDTVKDATQDITQSKEYQHAFRSLKNSLTSILKRDLKAKDAKKKSLVESKVTRLLRTKR